MKFKLFHGTNFDEVKTEVIHFVTTNQLAARSIAVEFLENLREFVLSVGYTENEFYHIELNNIFLGTFYNAPLALDKLEQAMVDATSDKDIIGHEFYVGENNDFYIVILSNKSTEPYHPDDSEML